jgi:hypothetical protein
MEDTSAHSGALEKTSGRRPIERNTRQGLQSADKRGHPAPSIVVVFELESAPYVYACWDSEADDARLTAWFDSRPDYAELLHRAIDLSGEAA